MSDMKRRGALKSICDSRGIVSLMHFTRYENLPGILANGLLPRADVEKAGYPALFNDAVRADRHKDAICLSISYPNYKMFFKYRQVDTLAKWAILIVRADVLWQFDSAFCAANASSVEVTCIPLAIRKEASAFEGLFAEQCEITGVHRAAYEIPKWFPTNPQAEILVFSPIPITNIAAVYFNDKAECDLFTSNYGDGLRAGVYPDYFLPRRDYHQWQRVGDKRDSGDSWQSDPSSIPL